MKIADQLNVLRDTLETYATQVETGGGAFIASDPAHMWEMAYSASNKIRIIICCIGEDMRGDFSVAAALGRADRQFLVMCTRGRSFDFERNALSLKVQNTRPLFQIVEEVRDTVRALLDISQESPVDYKGFKSFPLEKDWISDAYLIEFSCANDLPEISSEPATLIGISNTRGLPVP